MDSPSAPPPRPKRGICCPACGGRLAFRRSYRQRAGELTRYRRCLTCSARVKTREIIVAALPAK